MELAIPGYAATQTLYRSPRTLVCRALREKDGLRVVLKTPNEQYPAPQSINRLKREFSLIQKLASTEVIAALELVKHGANLAMVMEDAQAESLDRKPPGGVSLELFFKVAIAVSQALAQLHQAGVIHKDVNPANILWSEPRESLKLIDFDMASEQDVERLDPDDALSGSLPYISPEQTGRMNRTVDYRADFYSLGVTFYQLLTGRLPFEADDGMGWLHCHITKTPPDPRVYKACIPEALARMTLKLMAKNPEDRYQSARGLTMDLRECREQWQRKGAIIDFHLARQDVSKSLQIPQKLYGRDEEITAMLNAFEETARDRSALMMVAGYAGVGKSALVHKVYESIRGRHGYFIEGKFEQFQENAPYSAIAQAFRGLVRQILAEPAERLAQWKAELQRALGPNGQVVVDIVPELERVVGQQPSAGALTPTEAKNRFLIVFRNFVRVFCQREHPLVVFLDDLQWSDASTLEWIENMIVSKELRHLFIIGAYRNNEVSPSHPLMLTLDEIQKSKAIYRLFLKPLDLDAVTQLIADTLRCEPEQALPIAKLAHRKTEGNPFFVHELLKDMHRQGILRFSHEQGGWEWVAEKADRVDVSENVVNLTIERLKALTPETRETLKLAACIGSRFDLETLALAAPESSPRPEDALAEAVEAGILVSIGNAFGPRAASEPRANGKRQYRFQHDQVRQAAYALLKDQQRERVHLRIGRLLMAQRGGGSPDDRVIDIVNHLNAGARLLASAEERLQLAELNLRAAEKAIATAAFQAGLRFLANGMALLPPNAWQDQYELTFLTHERASECAYLCKDFPKAEALSKTLLEHARAPAEQARVKSMRLYQYTALGRLEEGVAEGLEALALLGVTAPVRPNAIQILKELAVARWRLGGKRTAALIDAPMADDPDIRLIVDILVKLISPAYLLQNEKLLTLCTLKAVNLSARHGLTPHSATAFASYAALLGSVFGDIRGGLPFGELALRLNDRETFAADRCKTLFVYAQFVHGWNQPWKTLPPFFRQAIAAGYQSGDMMFMAYACIQNALCRPELDLRGTIKQLRKYMPVIRDTRNAKALTLARLTQQFLLNLRGETRDRLSLDDASYEETAELVRIKQTRHYMARAVYCLYKLQINYCFGEWRTAVDMLDEVDALAGALRGQPYAAEHALFGFLALAAIHSELDYREQANAAKRMRRFLKRMVRWSDCCPANFLPARLIMEAEWARLNGRNEAAAEAYDAAVEAAKKRDALRYEALANELAGRWRLASGLEEEARFYLKEAHYFYDRWGAQAKTAQMEQQHPWLAEERAARNATVAAAAKLQGALPNESLNEEKAIDLTAVTKASQTLSDEVVLEKLLKRLMDIVRENAGADKAVLILQEKSHDLLIQAESAEGGAIRLMQSQPLEESESLSISIVQYVARSREHVVLDDAAAAKRFHKDAYLQRRRPKSVLCMPITTRGKLVGILYLENNALAGAFTAGRLGVLSILAAKAAISIENAQLYHQLERRVLERTSQLEAAQREIVKAAHYSGMADIASGVLHNVGNILNSINTSVDVSLSMIHKSKMPSFQRANQLLDQNRDRLGEFFSEDPKGEKLAQFYGMLGARLPEEYGRLKGELEKIQKCAILIKDVISTQQEYATAGLLTERLDLSSMVEDALVLLAASFSRHTVRIVKNYDKTPSTPVQKSKLIHVLTNLLKNAKESLIVKPPESRQIVIDVGHIPGECVFIRISDNGVGIPRDQLSKIFTHGFSTKKGGRGFGLHTCANYMTEMGGSIEVDSPGQDKGAGFTLKFPLKPDSP